MKKDFTNQVTTVTVAKTMSAIATMTIATATRTAVIVTTMNK